MRIGTLHNEPLYSNGADEHLPGSRKEARLPAPDGDELLRGLLPADMPLVPGNRWLEEAAPDQGHRLILLQQPGRLSDEDQYRYNLVLQEARGRRSWLGGVNALGGVPRFWSEEARLELSAEDVVSGLYHAGWEYKPFVDWLERLAGMRALDLPPHIRAFVDRAAQHVAAVRDTWRHFEEPEWIYEEVTASFPGPVDGGNREWVLEGQRMELALRFGMPPEAFTREAHRWTVDCAKVPNTHPAKHAWERTQQKPCANRTVSQSSLEKERLPANFRPAPAPKAASAARAPSHPILPLRTLGSARCRVRPSLSLAGMYQAMPDRRELVETLAAGVRKGAGRPGANVAVMWRLATSSLYASGDLPVLAAREALQNSKDSNRAAYRAKSLKPGEGRFEIRWDPIKHELAFLDTGVGMNQETLLGPFLTLGESTKRSEGSDAAGGFGIAKAVILGASPSFRWTLHTRDNLAVSEGPDRDVEVFEADYRQGVLLTLFDVPGDMAWDYALGRWRDIDDRMKELLAACDLPDIQLYYNGELIAPAFPRRRGSPVEVDGSWGQGATAKVKAYRRTDRGGAYWIRLDGLHQFKQSSVSGNLRADVVIDLFPSARPGTAGYPLNAGRDQFVEPARSTFRAVVKEVEKESLSVGKKKEDETFPLEEGTAEDAETREALDALESSLLDDPELAALLAEHDTPGAERPHHSADPEARGIGQTPDGVHPASFMTGDPLNDHEAGALLHRFPLGGSIPFSVHLAPAGGSPLPPALLEVDPRAVLPVWGAQSELPGFPAHMNTPKQVQALFDAMERVGHGVPPDARNALNAALSGRAFTGADLLELAHAVSPALDVFTGRIQPDPVGTVPADELEPIPLELDERGQATFPNGFQSRDPYALRELMLSADARGMHFPAPAWHALHQAEHNGTLSYLQLDLLRGAERDAMDVNAGIFAPPQVPLLPFGEAEADAIPVPRHKHYLSLEETGGLIPGLPSGLNTFDEVSAFLHEALRIAPEAVPEDRVEQVLFAIASDPVHRSNLNALVELVGDVVALLETRAHFGDGSGSVASGRDGLGRASDEGTANPSSSSASGPPVYSATPAMPTAPRARVNAGVAQKRPSGTNPFGAVAAVRIAAGYPKDRARAFKRKPAKWLPYLALWTLTLKLIAKEAKISRRYKPGFLLDDDTVGLASKQDGDTFALILVNVDRFEESVRANRERPLSIAAFVHGVAVHELAHLDGKMGDGHDEEYVAKREDLGQETAHLLPVLTKAAVKLLKLPEPKDPLQGRLLKLERDLQRAKEGRDSVRADRARAVRELEKALRECRKVLAEQGAPESARTGQAIDAAGPSPVPAHILVRPASPGRAGSRESFTDLELEAVRTATQSMEGARERWAFLAALGATDEELKAQLEFELGVGGASFPGGQWLDYNGSQQRVSVGFHGADQTVIRGKRLLLATRRVYGIEDHGEVDPRIRRVLFVLANRLRSALPEGIHLDYLYKFFARHRQTLVDSLARRFGSSDPALLPARVEGPPDADQESLPRWTPTPFSSPGPGERIRPLEDGDSIPGAEWLRIGDPVRFRRAHRCPVWHVTVGAGTPGRIESASPDDIAVLLETPIQNPDAEDLRGWIETVLVPLRKAEHLLEVH